MTAPGRRLRRLEGQLANELFRWAFTALALLAVFYQQLGPALVTGGLAWLCWRSHRRRPRRRR